CPLDRGAAALDDDVLETRRLRLGDDIEGGLAGFTCRLDPAGQDVVELERREVGLDPHLAVMVAAADLAGQPDRDRAAHGGAEIEPEPRAARIVERRLQLDVGIAFRRLLLCQRAPRACYS